MKKLLVLSVVGVFSLSSFVSNTEEKELEAKIWRYTCANGSTGTFICPCNQADAQFIGNYHCQ